MTNPVQTPTPPQVKSRSLLNHLNNFSLGKLLLSLLVVIVIAFVWQWVSSPTIVTVQGLGQVSVPATSATISVTISANAGTSPASIDGVKSKVEGIRSLLIASGVAESDISESQVISYPAGLVTAGREGFESTIQITAKTSNVTGVTELVGSLYNAGATLVNQPVLNVEDQDKLEEQATKEALKDARDQINKVGLRNFKFIRKMVAFSEQSSGTTSTSSVRPELFTQELSEGAATKGTFKIAKLVTVSYKMW
jgi:uncharacterized protein YggE